MFGSFPFKLFITKNIKFMKKYFFMAMATLVVSVAAVVGVKAYNYSQLTDLALANIEALSTDIEGPVTYCYNDIVGADGMYVVYCPICPNVVPGRANLFAFKKTCK